MDIKMDYFAHETAVIDDPHKIGKGSKIWHFSHIMPNAEIGENCKLGQNVFVGEGAKLGNNVKVQNNVSIYAGVVCEDDVFLGPSMVFTNIINPRSAFVRQDEYTETLLKKGVTIGANATLICGITLGKHVFVGAGSVVTHSFPDYSLVIGNPARHKGWMSEAGSRLYFGDDMLAMCELSNQKYKLEEHQVTRIE